MSCTVVRCTGTVDACVVIDGVGVWRAHAVHMHAVHMLCTCMLCTGNYGCSLPHTTYIYTSCCVLCCARTRTQQVGVITSGIPRSTRRCLISIL